MNNNDSQVMSSSLKQPRIIANFTLIYGLFMAFTILQSDKVWAQEYYSKGEEFLEQKQYRLAAIELSKAVQQKPDNSEGWRLLGYSYRRLDKLDSAVSAYSRVLQISPNDYDAHLALANLYSWIPKYDSSEAMYNFILANDTTDTEALLGLGRINAWQGRYQKSIDYYQQVLNFNPANIRAYSGMAWAYAWKDDLQNAKKYFELTIITDSSFAEGYEGLARINLWTDHPFTASRFIRQALILDPGNRQYLSLEGELSKSIEKRLDNTYTYWQEKDGGRITENNQIEETIFQRVSDRWEWNGNLAGLWSLRKSAFIQRRVVALMARYQFSAKVSLAGSLGVELLRQEMDRSSVKIEISSIKPLKSISIDVRRGMYEPWSNTRSTSVFSDISSYSFRGFSLSAGGGFWDISDNNQRVIGTANFKKRLINKPVVNVGYRYRFWDYKFRSPDYYSPLDLHQHELGADFRIEPIKDISIEGDGYYSLNSDEAKAISGSLSLELNLGKRSVGILSFSGYNNNFDYSMYNITGRIRISL
jgi:tetratricopeptide (TPR) repeat protein